MTTLARPTIMRTVGALTLALLLAACAGSAESADAAGISVADARTPVPAGPNGAVYMTLTNQGDADDRLVAASTDAAVTVELHETQMEGGAMRMQPLDGIDVPADGQAVLEPGGLHVMLIDVDDLAEGDTIDLTLTFENAGEQQITADVVPLEAQAEMEMGSETDEMEMESEG